MSPKPPAGTVSWTDLTVADAEGIRDFYAEVVGWISDPVDMGEYSDFNMIVPGTQEAAAGICHARGVNADLPPAWMIYLVVDDLNASLTAVEEKGGEILLGPKQMGPGSAYAIIQDPAGAVAALYQTGE